MTTTTPAISPTRNCTKFVRNMFNFIEDLEYLLTWDIGADDIARHVGVRGSAGVEKRLDRYNLSDTEIAEKFRQRKPGYCAECRLTNWAHRSLCSEFVPTNDHTYRRRLKAAARQQQSA